MPLFWITHVTTIRTLVQAPSRKAVDVYKESDAFSEYVTSCNGDVEETVERRSDSLYVDKPAPDVRLNAQGKEIDE